MYCGQTVQQPSLTAKIYKPSERFFLEDRDPDAAVELKKSIDPQLIRRSSVCFFHRCPTRVTGHSWSGAVFFFSSSFFFLFFLFFFFYTQLARFQGKCAGMPQVALKG